MEVSSLDEMHRIRVAELSELVAKVAVSKGMKTISKSIVSRKLGAALKSESEKSNVADDALSSCVTVLLAGIANRSYEKLNSMFISEDSSDEVQRYLSRGINNYCNKRLRRWSNDNEDGKFGYAARYTPSLADNEGGVSTEIWDTLTTTDVGDDPIEFALVMKWIYENGVGAEDIGYIKAFTEGVTWEEMAKTYGGTPDKYRKRVRRVLDRFTDKS